MIFGVVYGFAYAGVMTSILVSARALTPEHRRGALMGIILAFAWLGHAFGGYQGAAAFELTGSYAGGFVIGSAAGVVNLGLVGMLLLLAHPRSAAGARVSGPIRNRLPELPRDGKRAGFSGFYAPNVWNTDFWLH